MPNHWLNLKHRDRSLRKYDIVVAAPEDTGHNYMVNIVVIPQNEITESFEFKIKFTRMWIVKTVPYEDFPDFLGIFGTDSHSPLLMNFLRDLFQEEAVYSLGGKTFAFDLKSKYENKVYLNEAGKLNFKRNPALVAKENRFTRELVLRVMYDVQSVRGPSSISYLGEKCHYHNSAVRHAIDALRDRDYVRDDSADTVRLTYSALAFVENKLLSPFSDKIFLIAACTDEIYKLIEYVYKPAVEGLDYRLVFQEQSEPKGSIHDDIWQFIQDSKLIICDLTGQRPNCFIEYGYALAKDQHIVLCVEESEGKTEDGLIRVPFDTMTQKYSFWKREWLTLNKQQALEKFRLEIQERIEMKFDILDVESEI